jgi:hypothetical protein
MIEKSLFLFYIWKLNYYYFFLIINTMLLAPIVGLASMALAGAAGLAVNGVDEVLDKPTKQKMFNMNSIAQYKIDIDEVGERQARVNFKKANSLSDKQMQEITDSNGWADFGYEPNKKKRKTEDTRRIQSEMRENMDLHRIDPLPDERAQTKIPKSPSKVPDVVQTETKAPDVVQTETKAQDVDPDTVQREMNKNTEIKEPVDIQTPPPVFDYDAAPKFSSERLTKTAPIDSVSLFGNMALQGLGQAAMMAISTGMSPYIGGEMSMLLYRGMHTLHDTYYRGDDATPVDMAAAEGVEAVHNVIFKNGDLSQALHKTNKLSRGQLESVGSVDNQVIDSFSKNLKTSNSITAVRKGIADQYKREFGGI